MSRRDALKGLGAVGVLPLIADRAADSREQRASVPDRGTESATVSNHTREQLFDLGWRFLCGDVAGAENPDFDDSRWRAVDLPHDWSIEDLAPAAEAAGEGTIWVGG